MNVDSFFVDEDKVKTPLRAIVSTIATTTDTGKCKIDTAAWLDSSPPPEEPEIMPKRKCLYYPHNQGAKKTFTRYGINLVHYNRL